MEKGAKIKETVAATPNGRRGTCPHRRGRETQHSKERSVRTNGTGNEGRGTEESKVNKEEEDGEGG